MRVRVSPAAYIEFFRYIGGRATDDEYIEGAIMTDPNINANETFKPQVIGAGGSKQSFRERNNRLDFDKTLKTSQKKIDQQDDSASNSASLLDSFLPWGQIQAIFQAKFDYRQDFSFTEKIKENLSKNNISLVNASHNSNQNDFDPNKRSVQQQGIADAKEAKNPVQELAQMMSAQKTVNPNLAVFVSFDELVRNMSKFTNRSEIRTIADKIIEQAKILKAGEKTELVINLKPEWLGNVVLNISSEKGLINVRIYAGENTKALLDSNIAELQDLLKNANLNIGTLQVFVGSQQNFQNNQDNTSNSDSAVGLEHILENIKSPMLHTNSDVSDYYLKAALSWYNRNYKIFSKV